MSRITRPVMKIEAQTSKQGIKSWSKAFAPRSLTRQGFQGKTQGITLARSQTL
ncbi:MAG: hypothetical protein F6J90_04640 [Moorea sp. SIOASIH]|uniref:hypothetical protein n=1 Tax=Moorena sp. SIOASIH TaxID=2607817 RepID=UPI0013B6D368|nr:hypothetical protein [Moorena sp. SIOASIH]NEO35643.1 hypothetical protein [Moorena sp. SIOASIH]